MSKPRVTTNEQDKALADWWWELKGMGTMRDKAKELGISVSALYDAIARGLSKPTAGQRFKLAEYERSVPRESTHNVANELATKRTA